MGSPALLTLLVQSQSGELRLLRRLLAAGAAADAGDYDQRTALHIAAAEANLAAVQLLVAEGGADLGCRCAGVACCAQLAPSWLQRRGWLVT